MSNPIDEYLGEQKKKSNFLTINDGETVRVKIKDYAKATGKFGDTIAFEVDVYLPDTLKPQIFNCKNQSFLKAVVNLPKKGKGQEVNITRQGEDVSTRYIVEPVKKEEEPPEPDL